MAHYLIAFNVSEPDRSAALSEAIQAQGPWWNYTPDLWIVESPGGIQVMYESLVQHIATEQVGGDFLWVRELGPGIDAGWLPGGAWEWLNEQGLRLQNGS